MPPYLSESVVYDTSPLLNTGEEPVEYKPLEFESQELEQVEEELKEKEKEVLREAERLEAIQKELNAK